MKPITKQRSPLTQAINKGRALPPADETEEAAPSKSSLGWMRTGNEIEKEVKKHKAESASSMVPSFWLQDGEVKQVRFLSSNPIAQIYRYTRQVNGKFRKYTQPAPGDVDLFAKAGLNPSMVFVYEILDITGYLDKNNKRVKNTRKFWEVGMRIESSLAKIREKFGGLNKRNIEVSREGEKTKATYTFLPEDPSPIPTPREPDALTPQFAKFFAPPSAEVQARLLGVSATSDEELAE